MEFNNTEAWSRILKNENVLFRKDRLNLDSLYQIRVSKISIGNVSYADRDKTVIVSYIQFPISLLNTQESCLCRSMYIYFV